MSIRPSAGDAGRVPSEAVLASRKVAIRRPRVRCNRAEVPLPTFQQIATEDPLNRWAVERMLVGVATAVRAQSGAATGDDVHTRDE